MPIRRRHPAVLGLLFLLVAFIVLLGGARQPDTVFAQAEAPGVRFLPPPPDVPYPHKLYAGIPSHQANGIALPADATLAGGTTGYCVQVYGQGIAPLPTGANGFRVENGEILSSDWYVGNPADSSDDMFCAVVSAFASDDLPREPLTLSWHYTENGSPGAVHIDVPVVFVRLVQNNPAPVGGVGLVCTEGWDPELLTGADANDPIATPDRPDRVVLGDWSSPHADLLDVSKERFDDDRFEWCVAASPHAAGAMHIELDVYALFDLNRDDDDAFLLVAGDLTADASEAPQLRHLTPSGGMTDAPRATPNAIGAVHHACVIPTTPSDSLDPQDISFSSPDGATAQVISIYHDNTDGAPDNPGVPEGTLCFSWTSSTSGRQLITARITVGVDNPSLACDGARPCQLYVNWDTAGGGGPLVKDWYFIDHTVITTGTDPNRGVVTNSAVTAHIGFNAGNGTFYGGAQFTEWVFGYREAPDGTRVESLVDGVPVRMRIVGQCGYFGAPENATVLASKQILGAPPPVVPTEIEAITANGFVPFTVLVTDDPDCSQRSVIRVELDARYPDGSFGEIEQEFVEIRLEYTPAQSVPQLAWAGQTVIIDYAFAGENCDFTAVFSSSDGQPGAFVPVGGGHVSSDGAIVPFDADDCSAQVGYKSANPGAVDVIATIQDNPYSKIHFPIFFLAFEDLELSGPGSLIVSEEGTINASVRGWFTSTNPSGRPEETKPDGRTLPADRWILPDDWAALRGDPDYRHWPGSPSMPPARVTFLMENEGVRNAYRGESEGASGYFVTDGDHEEYDYNVYPTTGIPSILGSLSRPRIISENTDPSGNADTGIFGDFNLSYEGCALNRATGNPLCEPGDVAGRARFYAVVDYLDGGPNPPVTSESIEAAFTWAGYKRVSVVDTENPGIKYVVAHLVDRDGFCDAIGFHNVLGNEIRFDIDAGDGVILEAADAPTSSNVNRRSATAVSFDILDDLGEPMNEALAQPGFHADECQSWIKVSNSLLTKTNVMVTFPAPPVAVPGNVHVTQLVCGAGGYAVVSNAGDEPVSLNGFALRSGPGGNEQHLQLSGELLPGESVTLPGNRELAPWYRAREVVFAPGGYARLVWDEFETSRMSCDGKASHADLPASFPLDGEGEIVLDVVVDFGGQSGIALNTGWNLVAIPREASVEASLGADVGKVNGIYAWDAASESWLRFIPGAPDFVNTLDRFEAGAVYWVEVNHPFTLRMTP